MKVLTINVPETADLSEFDARVILAGELHERGKLTLSQAAEVAGLSYRAFIEVMGRFGFSVFNLSEDELLADLHHA